MWITQRQVAIGLQSMILFGLACLAIFQALAGSPALAIAANIASVFIAAALLYTYIRGWRYAPILIMLMSIILSSFVPPLPLFSIDTIFSILLPSITALILGTPAWVLISALSTLLLFVVRSGELPPDPPLYILYALIVGGIFLARLVTDNVLIEVRAQARRAEDALARAEQQSLELAKANAQQEQQIRQQSALLELVATLEAPAAPLADGVLFAPLVGHLDERRAQTITSRLLAEASAQGARMIILDIAGISTIDTVVARGLLNLAQALRLLGCNAVFCGIPASVALTLVSLEINLEGLSIARSPQEALAKYQEQTRQLAFASHSNGHSTESELLDGF